MATLYSTQIARKNVAGNSYSSALTEDGATRRIKFFDFVTTGGAQNDTVDCVDLPKGARLLGGKVITEALGASVTLSAGLNVALTNVAGSSIAASATQVLGATAAATAVQLDLANTFALGAGATLDAAGKLYLTIGGATPTTAKYVCGWVEYVQN